MHGTTLDTWWVSRSSKSRHFRLLVHGLWYQYTHPDGTVERVRVVREHSVAEGGGVTIFLTSTQRERQTEIGRLRFDDRAGTDSDVGMQDSKNDSHAIAQHVAKLRAAASERRGAEAEETARTEETRERAKREAKKKVEAKAQAEREANKRAREDARRRAKARADQDEGQKTDACGARGEECR